MDAARLERIAQVAGVPATLAHGIAVLQVAPERWRDTVRALRDDVSFDMLLDLTAVDWPARALRFDVVAHLFSTRAPGRVRLRTAIADGTPPTLDSLAPLHAAARFLERECHDMFGVHFEGHGDLRPILLYEGFVGHPLRKDYPIHAEQPLVPLRDLGDGTRPEAANARGPR